MNATIFDGTGRELYGPAAVVIEDERIMRVGPMAQIVIPRDAQAYVRSHSC